MSGGRRRLNRWWQRRWGLVATGTICFAVGAAVGRLLPPFVIDQGFWRDFLTGPPAAGVFALAGAGVAYGAARIGARTARAAARRQEWWNRAEWGLTLARSDNAVERRVGLAALGPMRDEATQTEEAIIVAVTTAVTGDDGDDPAAVGGVDTATNVSENETPWRRLLRWLGRRG